MEPDNETNKLIHALKKYCPIAYKQIIFNLKNEAKNFKDGFYTKKLKSSKEFEFVHGDIIVSYEVKNGLVKIIDLSPHEFLYTGYKIELKTYKGIPYTDEKDIFKIDLYMQLKENR